MSQYGAAMSEERQKRGFALMDPERLKKVASKGGRRAHEMGVAHTFTKAEASAAGKKGGLAPKGPRRKKSAPHAE
jgi:uncharacterized protein